MDKFFEIISDMAPEKALSEITKVLARLLQDLDSDMRRRFMLTLIEESGSDKTSGMAHL